MAPVLRGPRTRGLFMINRAVRDRLLASTIIAGMFAAAPALAQDAGGNVTPVPTQTGQTTTPDGPQSQASAGPAQPTAISA